MEEPGNQEKAYVYKESLKKSGPHTFDKLKFVDVYLNRPIAALMVKVVYNTRITPNGLTYFSFFLGMIGAFIISRGTHIHLIIGGVMVQLSSIIDGADGMLARSKGMCSDFGAHLDLFFDRVMDFSTIVGLAFGGKIYFKSETVLVIGLVTAGLYLLQTNLFYLTKRYLQSKESGETGEVRAIMFLGIMLFCISTRIDILIYLGFALTIINNTARLIYFINLGRKK